MNETHIRSALMGKKAIIIAGVLLLCGLSFGDYWGINTIRVGNFGVGIRTRMGTDAYRKHIHFDWQNKLNRYVTLILKTTWKVEYKPMLNFAYKDDGSKNRLRKRDKRISKMMARIQEGKDIWRFGNKIIIGRSFWFVAVETFFEEEWELRNRYFVGVNMSKNLIVFLMRQHVRNEGIWVIGTKLMGRL